MVFYGALNESVMRQDAQVKNFTGFSKHSGAFTLCMTKPILYKFRQQILYVI